MSNLIVLSVDSILKYLERQHSELDIDLPVLGKVTVIIKDLTFHNDRLSLPIHHNIPLIPNFEIDFEKFKCENTKFSFEIGRVGYLPGIGIDILSRSLAGYIGNLLGGSHVEVVDNQFIIEVADLIPENFRSISVNSLQVTSGNDGGIRIEFEF